MALVKQQNPTIIQRAKILGGQLGRGLFGGTQPAPVRGTAQLPGAVPISQMHIAGSTVGQILTHHAGADFPVRPYPIQRGTSMLQTRKVL
jgi:hypothetical protein